MSNAQQLLLSSSLTMSSVEVAKLTGKLHKNVLADCRVLIVEYKKLYINQAAEISALINSTSYTDSNGDKQPAFNLLKQAILDLMNSAEKSAKVKLDPVGLTNGRNGAILSALPPHVAVGPSTPDNQGHQRPQSNVVFLCPSKTRAALCRAYFIMVVRGGQPKGWPVPWPVLRTHHAPPPDYSQQSGGGNPSYQGVTE